MHLPHLSPFEKTPIVFLTVVTAGRSPALADQTAHEILREIWSRSAEHQGWQVGRYVLMPDHVHLFARPGFEAKPLAIWMRDWKRISSVKLNRLRRSRTAFWQPDYFDRFIRSSESYEEKWQYVLHNPVRRGLVKASDDWEFQGVIGDLGSIRART